MIYDSFDNKEFITFRIIFAIIIGLFVTCWLSIYFIREIDFQNSGTEILAKDTTKSAWSITRDALILKSFWKVFWLSLLVAFIRSASNQIYMTLPVSLDLMIEFNSNYELLFQAHKITLLSVVLPFSFLRIFFKNYDLITLGAGVIVIAFSPFLYNEATYFRVQLFCALVGAGEALVIPRFYEYAYDAAPKDREGIFMGFGTSLVALSVIISGVESGKLMKDLCSPFAEPRCNLGFRYVGLICVAPFLCCIVFRKYFNSEDSDLKKYISCSKESQQYHLRD